MLHIPILRHGEPYRSLDVARVSHHQTRELFVEISQANSGLIRRDLRDQKTGREKLAAFSTTELIEICRRAADHFLEDSLPLGDTTQTPEDYVRQISATTGMPCVLARRNMAKIHGVLSEAAKVINGLTRNIDWEVLDRGFGEIEGHWLSFYPRAESLSPYRIIQSFIRAGAPREAFGFYPTDHAGSGEILRQCQRSMLFGDASATSLWSNDPRVEIHGPGFSKIVIGEDCIDDWEQYLDVMVRSITDNGGRSCINASGIWVTDHAKEISEALAERLATILPRAAEDPEAQLAPFVDPNVASRISQLIDQGLSEPGTREVTSSYRESNRLVERDGCSYLLPTVILCEGPGHGMANREFMCPCASGVKVTPRQIPEALGPSRVLTAITSDPDLNRRLVTSPNIDRLNIGAVPTNQISWDQPHEGNLFEHLYARRAFQRALAV